MEQIGYSLIKDNQEIKYWGNIPGQSEGMPDMVILPNGDHIHAPRINTNYNGFMIVKRYYQEGQEEISLIEEDKVIITRKPYVANTPTLEELQAQLAELTTKINQIAAINN